MADTINHAQLGQILAAERPRIVRLCATLLGDHTAAEDAAQEVLIEAWRHIGQLRDPHAVTPWLSGIARNVSARQRRSRGRDRSTHSLDHDVATRETQLASDDDFTVDLDRYELAILLDRALALLPPETRDVLVQKYIEESPHGAIAARMGLSENVVAVRLHRGRLALRKLLTTELQDVAGAFGVVDTSAGEWHETRVWCPFCGNQKLIVRRDIAVGEVQFRCPACRHGMEAPVVWTRNEQLTGNIKSHKSLLSRQLAWCHQRYREGLAEGSVSCTVCGITVPVENRIAPDVPECLRGLGGVNIHCPVCGGRDTTPLHYLVLDLPETQRFWRAHPRMSMRTEYQIESGGRAAAVTSYASMAGNAHIDVVSDLETLAVLAIYDCFGS